MDSWIDKQTDKQIDWCKQTDKPTRHTEKTTRDILIYIHTDKQRNKQTNNQTDLDTYVPTYLHTYITYIFYLHTYILTHLHTYTLTYLHTYTLTYLHTYLHTCIYIYYILTYLQIYIYVALPHAAGGVGTCGRAAHHFLNPLFPSVVVC